KMVAVVSCCGHASTTTICATPANTTALMTSASQSEKPLRAATTPNAMPKANSPGISGIVAITPSRNAPNVQCGLRESPMKAAWLSQLRANEKPQKQNARHARRAFRNSSAGALALRLRGDFAGRPFRARARLAGRRHGGGTRRGRLDHRLAHRAFALEQVLDLVASQRLEFEQALGERFEVGALVRQDLPCLGETRLDQTPHFGVDLAAGFLGDILLARDLIAEEDLVLVLAIGDRSERIGEAPARDHQTRELGRLLDIGGGAGGDLLL